MNFILWVAAEMHKTLKLMSVLLVSINFEAWDLPDYLPHGMVLHGE